MRPSLLFFNSTFFILPALLFLTACNNSDSATTNNTNLQKDSTTRLEEAKEEPLPEKPVFTYKKVERKSWLAENDSNLTAAKKQILYALNRVDERYFRRLDSIIIPTDISDSLAAYMPFPLVVPELYDVDKIIIFSDPAQAFAAYENGKITRTGPTNMGRQSKPTPKGLFFTNWKAKETISTVNDEWLLKWNYNISNFGGVGFHEYALPGYPASHSCLRLQAADAEYFYYWAEQWKLSEGKQMAKGTPVIVFGQYDWSQPKPWMEVARDTLPKKMDISLDSLMSVILPYKKEILETQQSRKQYIAGLPQKEEE